MLSGAGTLEGWFRWRAGTAVMRDSTGPSRGWLLAFGRAETLRYGVGGQGFDTACPSRTFATASGITWWRPRTAARGPVRRRREHSHGNRRRLDTAAMPWHVMRNGTNNAFTEGEADEVAIYTRALTAQEAAGHHALGRQLAASPPPPDSPPQPEPPFAGTRRRGWRARVAQSATARATWLGASPSRPARGERRRRLREPPRGAQARARLEEVTTPQRRSGSAAAAVSGARAS